MPLALLLTHTFGAWRREVWRLSAWNQLVDLEETLLGRARGAFLARWFGTGLPMTNRSLRVAIANIDVLADRYRKLRSQAMRENTDLNLTEPVAGIAGTLVGALLSPTSSMALMAVISEQMPNWITTLAAVLNWLTAGALGVLVFAVGVPVAAVAAPFAAIAFRDQLAVFHRFLGGLAGLFVSARRFLEQLLGPRSDVRNPLLRQILDVLDDLAQLVPFVFALAAFVVVEIGPILAPLANQLDALIPLARQVFLIIGKVLADLFERLNELYTGKHSPWAILQGIVWTLRHWFQEVTGEFAKLYGIAKPAFEKAPVIDKAKKGPPKMEMRAWVEIQTALEDAFNKALPFIKKLTSESWLVKQIQEIANRLGRIADIFGRLEKHPAPATEPGWAKKRLTGAIPPWPKGLDFPDKPVIPDFIGPGEVFAREEYFATQRWKQPSLTSAFQRPAPDSGYLFVLNPDDQKKLARLRQSPKDVFAPERAALLKGQKPEDLLGEAQAIETRLRTNLFAVIDNLLPPSAADEMPRLQGLLWELDDFLYGKKAEFPVRDLPGADRLSLQVQKLRVRAPGGKESVVRSWSKDLKTVLEKQIYRTERLAPAAAG